MGCGLNKLEKLDDKRPGNIYSTLKRPHVETKIDVAYEYRYVDFTTLSQAEAPNLAAIRITSLRELPAQLRELYQQGFTVAAIHPFVQSYDGAESIPQEQVFRAVLIKKIDRNPTSDLNNEEYRLETELCLSPDQPADQKIIPDLVKRIEDAASQGSKFAGIIQGYCTAPNLPYSPSDSLSHCSSPLFTTAKKTFSDTEDDVSVDIDKPDGTNGNASLSAHRESADHSKVLEGEGPDTGKEKQESALKDQGDQTANINFSISTEDVFIQDKITKADSGIHDNCNIKTSEVLAIFNKPLTQQRYRKYYTVNIPMKISKDGNIVNGLEANWLEYMTDHFRKGCSLVNAVFYLGMVNEFSSEYTDGVFIFEDYPEQDPKIIKRYDAIVVEQWTILQGLEVHTDYMPLLNSLAVYGWQLTCVISTPIVKTSRDGNVTTKQIVFLQRPALPHKLKKKEPKFQWRFSKDDKHNRQSKKGKGNSKEHQHKEDKNDLERNKKNEELLKSENPEEANVLVNHLLDGETQSKINDLSEEILTSNSPESTDETYENNQTHNAFLHAEEITECSRDMDLASTEKQQREMFPGGSEDGEREVPIAQDDKEVGLEADSPEQEGNST
ncbi:hypothetical protein XENTR_v10016192 [Xenopus tropicalis]|uniref:LOC100127747 protein n=1 Tax=Xenopus tropicalis TaxID=8364 RepID=A8WH15_XENTR|eukprot:NP_001106555.1 raftlin [Xenopus tropicalis]